MDIRINPPRKEWPELCLRPADTNPVVRERVEGIIARVREDGDDALRSLAAEIDGFVPQSLEVSAEDIREALFKLTLALSYIAHGDGGL